MPEQDRQKKMPNFGEALYACEYRGRIAIHGSDWAYPLRAGSAAVYASIVFIGLLDFQKLTPGLGIDLSECQ